MRPLRTMAALAAGVLALGLAACGGGDEAGGGSGTPGKPTTVKLGLSAINASHLWVAVARDQKLMEPFGIDFQPVVFQGGATQVLPSLLGGSTQLGIASAQQTIIAYQQDPSVTMILNPMNGSPLSVVAKKGITSPQDVKGKVISVNAEGSSEDYHSATAWLEHEGIALSDVKFVTGGATSARVSALISGAVDVVLCSPPDVEKLTAAGATVLGEANEVPKLQKAASYEIVGKTDWLKSNKDTAVRFAQGYQATQVYMHDPKNKDAVVTVIANQLKVDTPTATDVYEFWIANFAKDADLTGAIHQENLVQTLSNAKEDGVKSLETVTEADLSKLYDNSYAQEAAAKSGGPGAAPSN